MLFTLDKLIAKVMKAFQGLMQDPLACKLYDMYKYECSRSVPFADAVYHANTHVVLHEDHCFRLQSLSDGLLKVQLLDPDKTEVPASEFSSLPAALMLATQNDVLARYTQPQSLSLHVNHVSPILLISTPSAAVSQSEMAMAFCFACEFILLLYLA